MVPESVAGDNRLTVIRDVFVLHLGGVGDLVLLSEPFAALKQAFPEASISLACRAVVSPVSGLFASGPDAVIPIEIDPYEHAKVTPDLVSGVRTLLEELPAATDIYVGAGLRPPWLSWLVAAKLQARISLMATLERPSPLAIGLTETLGLEAAQIEYVPVSRGIHETERYGAILDRLGVERKSVDSIKVPAEEQRRANEILHAAGLRSGEYVACFPGALPATPEKQWPRERFARVLQEIVAEFSVKVLLLGSESEVADIDWLTHELRRSGLQAHAFVAGTSDIAVAGALLAEARAYLGNDTGLAHLAAALGTPGVAVHGGGAWPMYGPWKPGSIGIANPLPCFGCYWDCTFGRGVCVESVPAENVISALSRILRDDRKAAPEAIELNTIPAEEQAVIADATKRYRALQADRDARLEALEQSSRDIAALQNRQRELQAAADERLEALREIRDALASAMHENHRLQNLEANADSLRAQNEQGRVLNEELQAAIEERDRLVRQLQDAGEQLTTALAEREARIEALTAREKEQQLVSQAAEDRERVIRELSAALEETDARAKSLQEAADLRAQKLQELEAAAARFHEVHALALERERVIRELQAALAETDARAKSLQEAADLRAQKIEELAAELDRQNERVRALENASKNFQEMHATAQEREKIIFELNGALNEREKNAQKVLEIATEREALIVELTAALEERDRRIAQLERVAEERLVALKETDDGLRAITAEADRRAIMLSEVTSLLREKTDES